MLEDEKEWEDAVLKSDKRLENVPDGLLHHGPCFEFLTKSGEKVICNSQYYYYQGDFGGKNVKYMRTNKNGANIFCYIIAKNRNGEVIGLRSIPFQKILRGFNVRAKIIVKEKGKGYAKPIDEAFIATLQWFANRFQEKVTWFVLNENAVVLEEFEHDPKVTIAQLKEKQDEQARWQSLYGEGGYFKVKHGQRVFEPEPGLGEIILNTRKNIEL